MNVLSRLDSAPRFARELVRDAARVLPSRRLRRLVQLGAMDPDARVSRELLHQTSAGLRESLLLPEVRAEVDLDGPARHLASHFERCRSHHPLNRLLYVYLKTYVPDELLRATDAMSMLHSLEVRVPFLDHRLVERAMAMPPHHKMRLTQGKRVLRDVARHTLDERPSRRKRGFSPPVATWLKGPLGEEVRDTLARSVVRRRGIFDPVAVEGVVRRCLDGEQRLVPAVMMLYSFETWAQRWLDSPRPAEAGAAAPVALTASEPDVSVIVVSWNTRELTAACLRSVERHLSSVPHEVIVVDNASGDGTAEMIAADFPAVRLIANPDNVGFGRANNQAMAAARGKWLLLLNSDTELVDDSVARLIRRVRDEPGIGVAHCRLRFPDGRVQHSAYRFPSLRLALFEDLGFYKLVPRVAPGTLLGGYWGYDEERDVDWVAGAFMLVPREVFERTGGFDERLFMYGEDMEWCYRIRDHGWRVRYYPDASIVHADHASSEMRWGDQRIALCLRRQRDIYTERNGRLEWRRADARAPERSGAAERLLRRSRPARRPSGGSLPGDAAVPAVESQRAREPDVPPAMTAGYYADPRPDVQALIHAPGSRILDVGCGEGALSAALRAAGAGYLAGVELEPRAAASARQVLDTLVEGSILDCPLPFSHGEFDYLVFADVLEHLPDPDRALERCLPYLAQDGHVVVSVPNMRFYLVLLRLIADRWAYADSGVRDRTHLRIFTRTSLQRMLARHGLRIERLNRNFRLVEDQSEIGRAGALATRVARATIAPALFPDLMAFQYVALARRR